MAKIFIIGATGHLGGAVLDGIQREHPSLPLRVLVRSEEKAARLRSKYPQVQALIGDLSSISTLEEEARGADIVINAAPDITHDQGIAAVLNGLKDSNRERKGFYLHTSGAACFYTERPDGILEGKIWDDVADIDEILSLKPGITHIVTDNLVRAASAAVHVAILSPPGIGGISPSPEHPMPLSTGPLLLIARAYSSGFEIGPGENVSTWVHVVDMARAALLLVNNALDSLVGGGGPPPEPAGFPLWGPDAYYFLSAEDVSFHALQEALVPVLHRRGVIASTEIRSVTHVEAARTCLAGGTDYDPDAPLPDPDSWVIHIAMWTGINMRVRASRLRRLGWEPREESVLGALDEAVEEFLKREKVQQMVSG